MSFNSNLTREQAEKLVPNTISASEGVTDAELRQQVTRAFNLLSQASFGFEYLTKLSEEVDNISKQGLTLTNIDMPILKLVINDNGKEKEIAIDLMTVEVIVGQYVVRALCSHLEKTYQQSAAALAAAVEAIQTKIGVTREGSV